MQMTFVSCLLVLLVYRCYWIYAQIMRLQMILFFITTKSMYMYTVFKPDKFKLACPDIFIDGSPLTMFENAKYLGVTFNYRCRDDNAIRRHLRSFYMRANTVIRKFNNCTLDMKLMLFRSYCLPSYCSHL